jgi:peptide/nickel transport system permease protein
MSVFDSGATPNPAQAAVAQQLLAREFGRSRGTLRTLARYARSKPLGTISLLVILLLILSALFAPLMAPYDPKVGITGQTLKPPSLDHPFGTDHAGRDILSRIIYGARVSLWISIGAVLLGTLSGTVIGVLSGFIGGWFDTLVQRVIDAAMSIPVILLAVVIVSLVEPSLNNVLIALSISISPRTARLVRGATLAIRNEQYVEGARAVGCGQLRLIFRYILPNIFAPVIVVASVTMGAVIIAESSLSFLGLGPPTLISWGGMLAAEARQKMETAPWMAISPGAAIMLTVLAFNLLGDALRDVLDPRLRV